MKVPFINASQQAKIGRSLKRNAVEKTIKSFWACGSGFKQKTITI